MTLIIELYGIPRQRAGCARCELYFGKGSVTLREALIGLAKKFPALGQECICDGQLAPSCTANLGGERFISDPDDLLTDGSALLILSADAGG
jgi:hypothetical protein